MDSGIDAKQFLHMPTWAKLLCLLLLASGIIASAGLIIRFFGSDGGNRDWLLIGFSGGQFLITTFVIALVLFVSQTDANIGNLRARADNFLSVILPEALARITLDDETAEPITVVRNDRRDIFGYDYMLYCGGEKVIRLWCGLNVHRLIVIYRMQASGRTVAARVKKLQEVFAFSLGGAESVNYKVSFEPLPGDESTISVWLTVATEKDLLTDPALKLFWSQDIAMMTESLLRTARRNADKVTLDQSRPRPQ